MPYNAGAGAAIRKFPMGACADDLILRSDFAGFGRWGCAISFGVRCTEG